MMLVFGPFSSSSSSTSTAAAPHTPHKQEEERPPGSLVPLDPQTLVGGLGAEGDMTSLLCLFENIVCRLCYLVRPPTHPTNPTHLPTHRPSQPIDPPTHPRTHPTPPIYLLNASHSTPAQPFPTNPPATRGRGRGRSGPKDEGGEGKKRYKNFAERLYRVMLSMDKKKEADIKNAFRYLKEVGGSHPPHSLTPSHPPTHPPHPTPSHPSTLSSSTKNIVPPTPPKKFWPS